MKTLIATLALTAAHSFSFAQQPTAPQLRLDELMTKADQERTGVSKLSKTEREQLDKWITDFAVKVTMIERRQDQAGAAPKAIGAYRGGNNGHWIKTVVERGSIIQLEDGSIWQLSPLSKVDAILWLVAERIVVTSSDNPLYPYKLINSDGRSSAEAKLISQ